MRIERWAVKRTACPDCGNPITECSDLNQRWYSYRRVCGAAMEREAASAFYGALHEDAPFHDGTFQSWAKERSRSHPYKYDEGVSIGVAKRDLAPHDLFTTKPDASPTVSVAEQAPGEQDDPDASGGDGHDAGQD